MSDSIAHIVAKADIKLHCFIDDYIAVVTKVKAEEKFHFVCDLLDELGLPLSCEKLTPLPNTSLVQELILTLTPTL